MRLSIMICTLPDREKSYTKLYNELWRQINALDLTDIEVFSNDTEKGFMSVGAKRNVLKKQAKGKYIVWIDDDDMVDVNYIRFIDKAMDSDPDIITFNMDYYINGTYKRKYVINRWLGEDGGEEVYTIDRNYFHLCPHKRDKVKDIEFPDINFQEDLQYSYDVKPLLNTEVRIDFVLYNYYFDEKKSHTRN